MNSTHPGHNNPKDTCRGVLWLLRNESKGFAETAFRFKTHGQPRKVHRFLWLEHQKNPDAPYTWWPLRGQRLPLDNKDNR